MDSAVGIIVSALRRRCLAEHVGEKRGVSLLLVGHEVDECLIFDADSGCGKILCSEGGETIVEQIKLDPFLIQAEGNAGEVLERVRNRKKIEPLKVEA